MRDMVELFFRRRKLLSDRKLLGVWGEQRAQRYLRVKGFQPLTTNWSCKTGELDLVMYDNGAIVFVEVKTRANEDFADAETSVNFVKQRKLIHTARYFIAQNKLHNRPARFDVVTIILPPTGKPAITHWQNAFMP